VALWAVALIVQVMTKPHIRPRSANRLLPLVWTSAPAPSFYVSLVSSVASVFRPAINFCHRSTGGSHSHPPPLAQDCTSAPDLGMFLTLPHPRTAGCSPVAHRYEQSQCDAERSCMNTQRILEHSGCAEHRQSSCCQTGQNFGQRRSSTTTNRVTYSPQSFLCIRRRPQS
jgi:hypothetical protein